jgi:hypothetical protein
MKYRIRLSVLLTIVLLSFTSYAQKWDLRKESDGIKVYTRSVAGSNVQEFKGEVVAKSNLSSILAVIDSVSEYPKWMYECTSAYRVKRINRESGYTYTWIHSPWPVSDRDLITYYKVTQDTSSKIITVAMKGVKDYIPTKSGIVRIPSMTGFWQLIPTAKGVTKIIYQVHCESGGTVPAAIVNLYITDTPYYNLLNLRKILESPMCPKTVMPEVKEF